MPRRTVTRRAALGLLASGATLSVLNTQAASSVSTSRSASVSTTTDATALLSIENTGDVDTPVRLTNRTSYDMSVTLSSTDGSVEFDVGDDGSSEGPTPTFSLAAGTSADVDVLSDGTVPVTVDATLLDSSGNDAGSIVYTRDVETRSQAGQVDVTANVTSVGNSGKYEFELENTGGIDVTLVAIGIYETSNPNAVEVSGGGIFSVVGQNGSVLNSPIPIDSTAPNSDTRRDFTEAVALDRSQTKTFEFDRFRDSGGGNVKMKGETVDLRLYFSDGSELDKTLQP
ncbi:hypothetical protein [Halosimplex salinum]|uniref:hypothetical protein n=1 Tax=Halosimplex salinum TaxID=1710538 RepID=UPI0013DD87C2|nr:hypothetical protein [Halosimplex salinum]